MADAALAQLQVRRASLRVAAAQLSEHGSAGRRLVSLVAYRLPPIARRVP